jgi:hypothetical protein
VFGNKILKNEYDSDFAFLKNKSYFIQIVKKQSSTFSKHVQLFLKSQTLKFVYQIRIEF